MPMYTFMFSVPPGFVSEEIIPIPEEALNITFGEDSALIINPNRDPLPVARCEECGALVAMDTFSQTTHNRFHESLHTRW